MRIAIGNDHAAVDAKRAVISHLPSMHQVLDVGAQTDESTDYPDYAAEVARRVATGEVDCGILLCGTGIGMCIAANKVDGVRAALAHSVETAQLSRAHNDSNVLCLSGDAVSPEQAATLADAWLGATFEAGRHARRVDKITAYEATHLKQE